MSAVFRGMDRVALDAAYNNVQAVPDFPAVLARFRARSAAFYERHECVRDIRYGDDDRDRFDLARASRPGAATVIYIHGGYWQTLSKEDFAFVSEGPLGHGHNVILAEYTLAPHYSMTQIVHQVGRLLDHLSVDRQRLALGEGPVCLVGHSAGGHLGLLHRSHELVAHTVAISPLVDLEPISLSWLNGPLQLTPWEIDRFSPVHQISRGSPTTIAVGDAELPEIMRHARTYTATADSLGEQVDFLLARGRDHFSVLEELASPHGLITVALARVLGSTWLS
jgi:arylformamidase